MEGLVSRLHPYYTRALTDRSAIKRAANRQSALRIMRMRMCGIRGPGRADLDGGAVIDSRGRHSSSGVAVLFCRTRRACSG